jgi:hypothetical protein
MVVRRAVDQLNDRHLLFSAELVNYNYGIQAQDGEAQRSLKDQTQRSLSL